MVGGEDDARRKPYGVNNEPGYYSSIRFKFQAASAVYPRGSNDDHFDNCEKDVEDEETEEEAEGINGVRMIGKGSYEDDDEEEEEEDEDVGSEDEDEDEEKGDGGKRYYNGKAEDNGIEQRPQKKRKLKSLVSNYEFAPRVRAPSVHEAAPYQPSSSNGKNTVASWTDHETSALLDAWGDRFLKRGRKSLRSEEWQEVANRVTQVTTVERTDAQCRNRLDTLKKKYRKEKMSSSAGGGGASKWGFYQKMDMLLSSPSHQPYSLSRGIDSGEYVFMNPKDYLTRANGLDEMRDSPKNSSSPDDSDVLSKGKRNRGRTLDSSKFRLVADSIEKFSEIYEKTEIDKRKQMVELENMRMDFQRQLEMQRRQLLERAQAEILRIRQGHDDENGKLH